MLMYAAICTRPDISFTVQILSQFSVNPTETHRTVLKRVHRYLSGTHSFKLTHGGRNTDAESIGYTDADQASNQNDRKSISGDVYMIGGGAITWNSKEQPIVALSSWEAEYISTHFNIADLLTNALPKEKHHTLTQDLGIVPSCGGGVQ